MRRFLFLMSILLVQSTFSASFTSVINGNWSNPLTWGEVAIIPQPGDEVMINHTVTLDDQFTVAGYWSVNAGSITIGANGILQAGVNVLGIAIQNSGVIVNNGQFVMPQLGNYVGSFTNNGTCTFSQLIYNADYIENSGDILDVDSILTIGEFHNNASANLYTDSIWVGGTFVNSGNMYLHEITNNGSFENYSTIEFRRLTNLGVFENYADIVGTLDMTNADYFSLRTGSTLDLDNNFLNSDSTNHDAVFVVEGTFNVGHNFYNADTIRGIDGDINVQDSSYNSGWFKQSFNFCDATPLVSQSPFVDFNTGDIEGTVRYCNVEGVKMLANDDPLFYPNPTVNTLFINLLNSRVQIIDVAGKIWFEEQLFNKSNIDVSALRKGIYIISIETEQGIYRDQLAIE